MYHARLYRWLSPDPIAGDISNPQSLNRYSYVVNNPTNLTDPLGLQGEGACYDLSPFYPACYFQGEREWWDAYGVCGILLNCGLYSALYVDAFGNTMFDAIAGKEGTYFGFDLRGNPVWGSFVPDPFELHFQGSLYGNEYSQTFASFDAYADWRTGIAALPASQIYAAWQEACQHSTAECSETVTVLVRRRGWTYNVRVSGGIANVGFPRTLPNPFTFEHPQRSYYTWSPVNTAHLVPLIEERVEAHYDLFHAYFLFPLHMAEWIAGVLTGNQQSTWTCSVVGGCR